jgi:hypothetical protein
MGPLYYPHSDRFIVLFLRKWLPLAFFCCSQSDHVSVGSSILGMYTSRTVYPAAIFNMSAHWEAELRTATNSGRDRSFSRGSLLLEAAAKPGKRPFFLLPSSLHVAMLKMARNRKYGTESVLYALGLLALRVVPDNAMAFRNSLG